MVVLILLHRYVHDGRDRAGIAQGYYVAGEGRTVCVCVCVCARMCVCVRERERERGSVNIISLHAFELIGCQDDTTIVSDRHTVIIGKHQHKLRSKNSFWPS